MPDFFAKLKNTLTPIEEDHMRIYPLSGQSQFKLSLLLEGHKSSKDTIMVQTSPSQANSRLSFKAHKNALAELEKFTGELSAKLATGIDAEKYELYYTEFNKNSHVDFHQHPVDVIIFLISGSITMELENGSKSSFQPGEFFFVPGGLEHIFAFEDEGAQCFELWKGRDFW